MSSLLKKLNQIFTLPTITISREDFFKFIKKDKDKDGNITKSTQHYLDFYDKYMKSVTNGKEPSLISTGIGLLILRSLLGPFCFLYRRMVFNTVAIYVSFIVSVDLIERIWSMTIPSYVGTSINISIMSFYDYLYLRYVNRKFASGTRQQKPSILLPMILLLIIIMVIYIFVLTGIPIS